MFNLHDGFSIKKPSILGIPHLWKPHETSTFGLSGNLWGNNILCWIDRLAFLKRWFWTLYLSSLGLDIYTIVLVGILGVNPSPPWDLSESSIRWGSFLVMPLISVETTLLLVQIWVISCTILCLHISGPARICFEFFECWNRYSVFPVGFKDQKWVQQILWGFWTPKHWKYVICQCCAEHVPSEYPWMVV